MSLTFILTVGLMPLAYLVLFIVLPWKEEGVRTAGEGRGFPWGFACRLGGLLLLNLALYLFMRWRFMPLLPRANILLPVATQVVIYLPRVLSRDPVGFFALLVLLASLLGAYLALPPNERARRIYAATVYAALLLLLVLVVAAWCLPLFTLPNGTPDMR